MNKQKIDKLVEYFSGDPELRKYLIDSSHIDHFIMYCSSSNQHGNTIPIIILSPYIADECGDFNWTEDKLCFFTKAKAIEFAKHVNKPYIDETLKEVVK